MHVNNEKGGRVLQILIFTNFSLQGIACLLLKNWGYASKAVHENKMEGVTSRYQLGPGLISVRGTGK